MMQDIFNIIRILSYAIIALIFLWRFVYAVHRKWLSFFFAITYFNGILISYTLLEGGDPQFFRDLQTIWVGCVAINMIGVLLKDWSHMNIKASLRRGYESF